MPLNMLVVDDEPDLELLLRQKFRRAIRKGELAITFATDGRDALACLEKDPTLEIVLTDINMPGMDGLTLLRHIQELERLLKVVVVSAYGDISNIRTAMNRGAFDFIVKPIDFEDLQTTVDRTHRELVALRKSLETEKQYHQVQRDLEIASRIQQSVLPTTFPAFPGRADFDLYATLIPALEVGGDLYDFFLLDEHHLGFSLGDVSGKGVGAAMVMVMTRTLLRVTAMQGFGPAECLRRVNRALYPECMRGVFITAVYGILDTRSGAVVYANAGHNLPYVVPVHGTPRPLKQGRNVGLCLVKDFAFTEAEDRLELGEGLLLYTDGVPEAINAAREQFGDARLEAALHRNGDILSASETVHDILRDVTTFTDGADQSDDITLLHLHYNGAAL